MKNDNEQDFLDNMKKNLERRADMEAGAAYCKKRETPRKRKPEGETAGNGKKKDMAKKVEVIVEEYQDPEDAPVIAAGYAQKKGGKASDSDEPAPKKPKKKKRRKKHLLLKLLILFAVLIFGVHYLLMKLVAGTDYQPYETSYVRAEDVITSPWVENILIVGTDARNKDSRSRSDCIMILSLNRKHGKMVMTSILRDSYVEIPGHGQNRINAAFQYGGADLLIQTIETNFKIGIDHYIKVDFFSFIDIIDALGGVEIDVDESEANYVNMYLCEINELLGVEQGNGNLTFGGLQTLSGKQALGYSRIRYIGTDFARTGRQREVLNAMITKVKTLNPGQLLGVCRKVLPQLTTDISDSELSWLIMQAPFILSYESSQCHIPADGTWKDFVAGPGMEVLQMDFGANREILRQAIYEKSEAARK